ncbi:beta-lactamase family protein [Paenibacillus sp. GSMTC-2017]|uniref:serine hydrolase domain-containing protein n=1 Tax=Paenibacillus sp. GSMTC-2017 TaxID=2794350 RepID=UPI0018D6BA7B|nr:serine hydrolase domain-containing protein [Paenibacillus sp. GSMTC-2017]MBH5316793.1 beta-lactamase family protein [Paenibacillus sp. GSMTC-2017]
MTNNNFNLIHWQERLDKLRATYNVPGAVLAVYEGGTIYEMASGVLNHGSGLNVTTDSVFELGSIAKIYTATLVMQLVEAGKFNLDTPVSSILPEFIVADAEATRTITIRQLLSHTSGLTCDFNHDTGRGDDCLARYVKAIKGVALDCPPGTIISYSGIGYIVLGRLIEAVTGLTWDQAMKDLLLSPLGLTSTITLPEEVLRYRAAIGHLVEGGKDPIPVSSWDYMPRSAGPGGRVIATAADLIRVAQMHLDGGKAPDGNRVIAAETVALMQRYEINVPDKWTVSSDGWGLGWTLYNWNGISGFGHDGASIGQYSYVRVVPDKGVAIALVTNGGGARLLYASLFRELLHELAGVSMPESFAPPTPPPSVDFTPFVGTYKREGVVITVFERDNKPYLLYDFVDGMKDLSPPLEMELVPVSDKVFAGSGAGPSFNEDWMPVVFSSLPDGTGCCYIGMRAAPKIA